MRFNSTHYSLAMQALIAGLGQLAPDGNCCAVCEDSGHQAWECHHNPLVLMARAEKAAIIPIDKRTGKPMITNAMKAECIGDFSVEIEHSCSACHFHGAQEDCEVCGGEINWTQHHQIPWDTMKEIYKAMAAIAVKWGGQ